MIRGALATTSFGNMTLFDRAGAHALGQRLEQFIVRLRPSSPPTPISVKPKPSWMPVPNSAVMMISSEKPGWPSGSFVVMRPMALSDEEFADDELERAGVLALVEVEVEIAAALDDAGVDRQADAVRRLEAEREVERAEVAAAVGGERRRGGDADVLDHGLHHRQVALDRCAELDRDPTVAELDGDVERSDLDRPRLRCSGI